MLSRLRTTFLRNALASSRSSPAFQVSSLHIWVAVSQVRQHPHPAVESNTHIGLIAVPVPAPTSKCTATQTNKAVCLWLAVASDLIFCSGAKLPRVAEPSGEAYVQAVTTLLPYLLSHRSRLAAFTASQPASTKPATSTTASQAASTAASTTPTQPATASQATTGDRAAAASESGQGASEADVADAPSTSYSSGMGEGEEGPGSPVHSRPHEFLAGLQPEQRHRLAVLVDTAILKVTISFLRPKC